MKQLFILFILIQLAAPSVKAQEPLPAAQTTPLLELNRLRLSYLLQNTENGRFLVQRLSECCSSKKKNPIDGALDYILNIEGPSAVSLVKKFLKIIEDAEAIRKIFPPSSPDSLSYEEKLMLEFAANHEKFHVLNVTREKVEFRGSMLEASILNSLSGVEAKKYADSIKVLNGNDLMAIEKQVPLIRQFLEGRGVKLASPSKWSTRIIFSVEGDHALNRLALWLSRYKIQLGFDPVQQASMKAAAFYSPASEGNGVISLPLNTVVSGIKDDATEHEMLHAFFEFYRRQKGVFSIFDGMVLEAGGPWIYGSYFTLEELATYSLDAKILGIRLLNDMQKGNIAAARVDLESLEYYSGTGELLSLIVAKLAGESLQKDPEGKPRLKMSYSLNPKFQEYEAVIEKTILKVNVTGGGFIGNYGFLPNLESKPGDFKADEMVFGHVRRLQEVAAQMSDGFRAVREWAASHRAGDVSPLDREPVMAIVSKPFGSALQAISRHGSTATRSLLDVDKAADIRNSLETRLSWIADAADREFVKTAINELFNLGFSGVKIFFWRNESWMSHDVLARRAHQFFRAIKGYLVSSSDSPQLDDFKNYLSEHGIDVSQEEYPGFFAPGRWDPYDQKVQSGNDSSVTAAAGTSCGLALGAL